MQRINLLLAVLVLVFAASHPAWADFDAGQRAWDTGNVDEALTRWRAAADAGDRRAMLALGRLHHQGLGVIQDYVEAHKWLNLAASQGEVAALAERDALAAKMTPAQVAKAQERAAAWRPGTSEAGGTPDTAAAGQTTAPTPAPASNASADRPPPQAIREAQALLDTLGYRPGPADGIWGRRTGAAYQAFLRDAGLPVAETLNPEALRAMRALARSGAEVVAVDTAPDAAPQAAPARILGSTLTPMSEDTASGAAPRGDVPVPTAPPRTAIREAQELLAKLGYAPGPADGRWNDSTARAHRTFLRDSNQPVAEMLTIEALRAMRSVAAARPGGGGQPAASRQAKPAPDILHRAAQAGDIEVLKAALAAGVDVDTRDGQGWTALMHAVNKDYPLLVEPLLAAGAGLDIRAPDGATALFMAVVDGHKEIVALLMEAGADAAIEGPQGKTATEVARLHQDPAVAVTMGVRHVFRDCAKCPEMVVVPAGSFRMGLPEWLQDRDSDEGPVHEVTIAESFAVGVYEVTFDEWDACRRGGGCSHHPDDEGWGRGRRPVIDVSWEDAQEYVRWLSRETGKRYRLLSASVWEYVARAGTTTEFWWGNEIGRNRANCDGCGSRWDNVQTAPVGSFSANGFGLHDVHGNVSEWVEDCSHDLVGAPKDGSAWTSGGDCEYRLARGGSWASDPMYLPVYVRIEEYLEERTTRFGFRVAQTFAP